jgi:hypothetical protein
VADGPTDGTLFKDADDAADGAVVVPQKAQLSAHLTAASTIRP